MAALFPGGWFMRRSVFALVVVTLWCATACFAQDSKSNGWVGTWKLDTAQSKLQQAPQQETLQVDAGTKDNIKWSLNGTAADGTTYSESFDGKADGKSYPIMRDNKEFAQITYRWVNDNSVTALVRIPDGGITSEKIDLAPDGKTMTLHLHSKTKEGKVLADEVAVFRKQ
jgi:hypothetical protein